jgi:hypothetical protein
VSNKESSGVVRKFGNPKWNEKARPSYDSYKCGDVRVMDVYSLYAADGGAGSTANHRRRKRGKTIEQKTFGLVFRTGVRGVEGGVQGKV